ncbi:MAG: ABC-F family ATP-binding cassette domain-containing protein [Anaerovoracaceae bacterium]
MVLLTAENIKKSYTEKTLLDGVDISIHEGDKIGLIGVNGTGKSTLLKIIAGVISPEGGNIIRSRQLKIGYLSQNPAYNPKLTIEEQVKSYIEESGSHVDDYRYKAILTRLGIDNFEKRMDTLSGGQRKRVAMAAVLCEDHNLLILDEPTNHMDSDIIEWLENYLMEQKSGLLMITHDRYFLDRVTNKIVEIEGGKSFTVDGNYNKYLEMKAIKNEMLLASERKRATIYRKELEWIRRGAPARTTKAKGRIERFEQLENSKLEVSDNNMEIASLSSRLGKKIVEINHIEKGYEGTTYISDFSYNVLRNDRIGIIGPNGCGKSTLLKIIMEEISPDRGYIEKGDTVRLGYFSQENERLDQEQRIIKFIEEIASNVVLSDGVISASQMLERFLFPSFMHSVKINALSGGEKRRLYLLSVLMQAPNVLILDEPTNDLDIETLTILEDYLDSFDGAVIIVSHDRYFLDRTCHRTFSFWEGGIIKHFPGGYTDYALRVQDYQDQKAREKKKPSSGERKKTGTGKLKFSYNEKREFESIDEDIEKIEEELETIDQEMGACITNYSRLSELQKEKEAIEIRLLEKMERWEYLHDLNDKIERGE